MQYIFGLGNPGEKYRLTRHNVGFMVADELVNDANWQHAPKFFAELYRNPRVCIVKPQTFMNDSGKTVRAVLEYYEKDIQFTEKTELKNVFVIFDDLDLEVGSYKIQFGKGPKVHNGLLSIYNHLHTDQFWHVRVGVDGRKGDRTISGRDYVLVPFLNEEKKCIDQAIEKIVQELNKTIDVT